MMSDFDYDSDEFEINIDDPDLVVESSKGYEDLQTPMNIIPTPPKTIDVSAENENNNSQKEEDNVNDTANDESDGDEDGLVFLAFLALVDIKIAIFLTISIFVINKSPSSHL